MYFDGTMDIEIACEVLDCDLYGMIPFFREYPYETDAPDPDLLEAILVEYAFKPDRTRGGSVTLPPSFIQF